MTEHSIPGDAEGLPVLNRRRLLLGLAAASAAPAFPTDAKANPAENPSGELADLLQTHREALQRFEDACPCMDVVNLKREPTLEEEAIWENASSAEEDAFMQICSYHPANAEEEKAKGAYLLSYMEETGCFHEEHLIALLKSMAGAEDDNV